MLTSAHSDAELFLFIRSTAFPHGRRQNPMVAHNWFGQESRPFLGFGTHIEIHWRFVNGKYSCSWLCSMHICLVELVCVCIYCNKTFACGLDLKITEWISSVYGFVSKNWRNGPNFPIHLFIVIFTFKIACNCQYDRSAQSSQNIKGKVPTHLFVAIFPIEIASVICPPCFQQIRKRTQSTC